MNEAALVEIENGKEFFCMGDNEIRQLWSRLHSLEISVSELKSRVASKEDLGATTAYLNQMNTMIAEVRVILGERCSLRGKLVEENSHQIEALSVRIVDVEKAIGNICENLSDSLRKEMKNGLGRQYEDTNSKVGSLTSDLSDIRDEISSLRNELVEAKVFRKNTIVLGSIALSIFLIVVQLLGNWVFQILSP